MRIAVISAQVFKTPCPGYAGLEMVAWHCAKGLRKLGHQAALIAPDGSTCEGCDVIHSGPPGTDEKQAFDRYWPHLLHFHAIISHDWQKWCYSLLKEGRLHGPVLGVCHAPIDTMFRTLPDVPKPCMVQISDDQRAHFEALFNRPGRTCHNGIDPDFYRPMDANRQRRALFLARFSTIKGADLAVQACKAAGVPLDLVGDTTITNEPEYLAHVKSLCDGHDVRFLGGCTRGVTVRHYSTAHAFIHPNQRFREPFGLAPVEAMACGLPVVAWDNGAMRETVKHGETGYLCNSLEEMTHALKLLFEDGAVTDEVRQRCRDNALRFTVDKTAKRYEELVNEAIARGW